jgi:hypothetical protein
MSPVVAGSRPVGRPAASIIGRLFAARTTPGPWAGCAPQIPPRRCFEPAAPLQRPRIELARVAERHQLALRFGTLVEPGNCNASHAHDHGSKRQPESRVIISFVLARLVFILPRQATLRH